MFDTRLYNILIIDDNQNNLHNLRTMITGRMDVNILEAYSGERALTLIVKLRVDIIILNVQMSGLDGFETANLIKQRKELEGIPIIFLSTAYTGDELKEYGFDAGTVDYLSKPVNEEHLINRLNLYLKIIEKERGNCIRTQDQLKKANSIKDLFLANMSHELRTPMNGIMGMLQLLEFTKMDKEQAEIVEMMKESSVRMMSHLKNLIGLTTLETGKNEVQDNTFNVKDLINNVVSSFSAAAKNKKIGLSYNIDESLPQRMIGDDEKIGKILIQLIDNAIKFTNEGGVSVDISGDGKGLDDNGCMEITFAIKDTGIGIECEDLNKLFEKFTQLDDTFTKKYQGVGLGLTICQKLTKILEGKINVESTPNIGSTFKLKVYLKSEPTIIKTNPGKKDNCRILAVDDDDVSLQLTKLLCKHNGFEVSTACSGREALELFSTNHFDIVFMDIQMPDMSGLEVTKRMREMKPVEGNTPVIIAVTAYVLKGDREKFLSHGMDDYISKPIDLHQFNELIKKWTNFFL